MCKYCLLLLSFIILSKATYTQELQNNRFKDLVYKKATKLKNQSYTTNIPAGAKKKAFRFDLYQPENDTSSTRPLIIWMHGGGFKLGSKRSRGIPAWSKTFAQRGYVCAAINYRKSRKKPLRNFNDLAGACYDAVLDLNQAVLYFKNNQALYRIDTNCIILGGNSAGAIIAMQAVYSSPYELAKLSGNGQPDTLSHSNNLENIAAVINFWGAIFDTSWMRRANIPIVSVHGNKDRIVPYKHADSPLFGSFIIHEQAGKIGIVNELKTYQGYAHELQKVFNPFFAFGATHRRWLTAGQFAADFLSRNVLK